MQLTEHNDASDTDGAAMNGIGVHVTRKDEVNQLAYPRVDFKGKHAPITLARTYKHGITSGFWFTQREAAPLLNATQGDLSKALWVVQLPIVILDAFGARDSITISVIDRLKGIRRRVGIEAMCRHAIVIASLPSRPPIKRVLSILEGGRVSQSDDVSDAAARPSSRRRNGESLPLVVAKEYFDGVAAGKWASAAGAVPGLGHSVSRINRAKGIASLPQEVVQLFDVDAPLTFETGISLITLRKLLGDAKLRRNARKLAGRCHGVNAKDLIWALTNGRLPSTGNASVKLTIGSEGRSLRISAQRIGPLVAAKAEIEAFLEEILKRPS